MERRFEASDSRALPTSRPCSGGATPTILYAWTSWATPLELPSDVAFQVGGRSGVDWLVLQVHYATVRYVPQRGDNTTVVLTLGRESRPKRAGVLLMVTSGYLPPKVP